jgi:putative transposase
LVSERRAWRLVGQHRSTTRCAAAPVDSERKLVARMTKLAEPHPRWGHRMVHALLVEEGWPVNKRRIERLWRQEGLQVPPRTAVSQWAESDRRGRRQCLDAASGATQPCLVL